jgi:hypothetical protein
MLRYLQWLAIAGVWLPLAVVAAWFALAWATSLVGGGSNGWGLAAVGLLLSVAAAHALAVSSLVGVGLLVVRRTPRILLTAISALIGASLAFFVLGRLYLGIGA